LLAHCGEGFPSNLMTQDQLLIGSLIQLLHDLNSVRDLRQTVPLKFFSGSLKSEVNYDDIEVEIDGIKYGILDQEFFIEKSDDDSSCYDPRNLPEGHPYRMILEKFNKQIVASIDEDIETLQVFMADLVNARRKMTVKHQLTMVLKEYRHD
jgi:hypothetical protein